MQFAKIMYIQCFEKEGETRSQIKLRFSVKIGSEEGENGDEDAVKGYGKEAVSMVIGCGKAFRLSAVQHTR